MRQTMERTLVIAEIGINHQGNLDVAKRLIQAAQDAGADVVKFQKRDLSICYTEQELAQVRVGPWGQTNGDLKRLLEFDVLQYDEISSLCTELGIEWTASPWDVPSWDFLNRYRPKYMKLAS